MILVLQICAASEELAQEYSLSSRKVCVGSGCGLYQPISGEGLRSRYIGDRKIVQVILCRYIREEFARGVQERIAKEMIVASFMLVLLPRNLH